MIDAVSDDEQCKNCGGPHRPINRSCAACDAVFVVEIGQHYRWVCPACYEASRTLDTACLAAVNAKLIERYGPCPPVDSLVIVVSEKNRQQREYDEPHIRCRMCGAADCMDCECGFGDEQAGRDGVGDESP